MSAQELPITAFGGKKTTSAGQGKFISISIRSLPSPTMMASLQRYSGDPDFWPSKRIGTELFFFHYIFPFLPFVEILKLFPLGCRCFDGDPIFKGSL